MGMGRVVRWNRRARVNYIHCRTGECNLQAYRGACQPDYLQVWRNKIDDPERRKCGRYAETDKYVTLVYTHGEVVGNMDERGRWMKKQGEGMS